MKVAILVHGGAGQILDTDRAAACAEGCLKAARAGHRILLEGGRALDAAQAAVVVLEDDPQFNAGTGAALTAEGRLELDAMVMNGEDLAVGGVIGLTSFKNPVLVARAALESGPHALYAAEGAARFAREQGFHRLPEAEMVPTGVLKRWHGEREAGWPRIPGTVGAVAIDLEGHVAAATSTGGISGKLPGRVGDTPLPGSGAYADDRSGAAAATGAGESILRVLMAQRALMALEHLERERRTGDEAGDHATRAAQAAVDELARIGGEGGIILVDRHGHLGFAYNTRRMSRAWIIGENESEGSGFE
ncbi:MAG: isoaspartyl peptidase/L-asparaginase [Deltaproteobacteria bacterium]|nr:isoaspartyl peptidase/L-asparaginase [Deltaproteobacteria bacterium]